jgi:hypothetical protein
MTRWLELSRPAAAKALGLCDRTVASYAHGRHKLPRWLACREGASRRIL